jgi:hypothetical protein
MKTNITKKISRMTLTFALVLLTATSFLAQNNIEADLVFASNSENNISLEFYSGANEKPTEIESWMSSTNFWGNIQFQLEADDLKIEPWMSSADYWNDLEVAEELKIETWMHSTNFWNETELNEDQSEKLGRNLVYL